MKKYRPAVIALASGLGSVAWFLKMWFDFQKVNPMTGEPYHDPYDLGGAAIMMLLLVVSGISLLTAILSALIIWLRSRRAR